MTDRKRLSTRERAKCFDAAGGICHLCGMKIQAGEAWDVSHEIPLAAGGDDTPENRKPAHRRCHRAWTANHDAPLIAKTKRQHQKHIGAKEKSGRGFWKPKGTRFDWKSSRYTSPPPGGRSLPGKQ